MRIAFTIINANRREGTSRAILEVAERLALDHHVDLWARTVEDADLEKLNWIRVPGPKRPEVGDFASFKWLVDRRIRRMDYDIIHSPGPNTALADVYAIQTVHPVKMRQMVAADADFSAGWARRLSRRIYDRHVVAAERQAYTAIGPRGPRAFLPVSAGTKVELLAEYPGVEEPSPQPSPESERVSSKSEHCGHQPSNFPNPLSAATACDLPQCAGEVRSSNSNVVVVPNGADLEIFHPDNRGRHRMDVRTQHGLSNDDFVLVFSGGDWRRKGLDLALKALARVSEPSVKLLVVGHDRAGADVRDLASQLNISDRVRFAGFVNDVHRYYAAGDVFLFPTSYEAFSLASIEAAASGLPVLMPDVSGAAELIGSGDTGTIILRDPEHIAATITEYVSSPQRVAQEGQAARELVERRFSWDAITAQTLDVYERLIERRSRYPLVAASQLR